MSELTPEEQQFFASGGDTSHLKLENPDPGVQGVDDAAPPAPGPSPAPSPLDLAGLGNTDAPAPAPPPPPPAPAPQMPPAPPPIDTNTVLQALQQAQQNAANLQAQLDAARKPAAPPPPAAPDPDTDPLGSMLHQLAEVNRNVAELQTRLNEQQTQQTQMREFQRFQQNVLSLRDQFKLQVPDFDTAYTHLRDARTADLRMYGVPEDQIAATIFKEEIQLSQAALQQGKNPAEVIYEMSRRHGYAAMSPAPAPAPAPKAPAPPPAPAAQQKLNAIQRNGTQQPLPKTPAVEEFTVESLKDASDADLNKLVTDPAAWAKISGGSNIPL